MPTRNELLADHFLKAAGIAAVYVDDAGAIGTVDVVGIDAPSGWVLLCCAPGKQIGIATKAARPGCYRDRSGCRVGGAAFGRRGLQGRYDAESDGHLACAGRLGTGRPTDCGLQEEG